MQFLKWVVISYTVPGKIRNAKKSLWNYLVFWARTILMVGWVTTYKQKT
jgi:hypothetical protein